uniref:Complement factor properdin n=3 Tax=Nothobranchius pienaari TaxID=704102 RepID=A0A1A8MP22_9TELE
MMETQRFLLVWALVLVSGERSESVRCFASIDLNTGECDSEIGDVNEDDCCQNPNYGYQTADGACQSCGPPTWSSWSSWSLCTTLCGEGVRQKSRKCYGIGQSECENPIDKLHVEPCIGTCCNGEGWDSWLPWTPCSVTCGGQGVRKRQRVCSAPLECRLTCTGPTEETETCEANNTCPVHGGWSGWSGWAQCSGSCVSNQGSAINTPSRERKRSCSNPNPSTDTVPPGNSCPGDASQRQDCSELPNCPVDGNWGAWSAPGPCSVTCGEGLRLSSRICDSPAPKYGGKICEGPSTESSICQSPCPVHGVWSGWSNWGECTASCIPQGRPPTRSRQRSCTNPAPSSNPLGRDCEGDNIQTENCDHLPPCSVDGSWGPWSPYTSCPVSCGVGLQESIRRCDSPTPKHGGRPCPGDDRRTSICSTQVHCPVHGVWSEWSSWETCKYAYGDKDIRCLTIGGKQKRERQCLHRAHNGSFCAGDKQLDTRVCYNVDKCYVKGSWEGWGEWGFCKPPCGPTSRRVRSLICDPDYMAAGYRPTIGRQKDMATFVGKPTSDCGTLPEGIAKKTEIESCKNAPPCT